MNSTFEANYQNTMKDCPVSHPRDQFKITWLCSVQGSTFREKKNDVIYSSLSYPQKRSQMYSMTHPAKKKLVKSFLMWLCVNQGLLNAIMLSW